MPLCHGWCVDPQDPGYEIVKDLSYNHLVEKVINNASSEDSKLMEEGVWWGRCSGVWWGGARVCGGGGARVCGGGGARVCGGGGAGCVVGEVLGCVVGEVLGCVVGEVLVPVTAIMGLTIRTPIPLSVTLSTCISHSP